MNVFTNYAQYYDLLNQQKDYIKEVDYIISLIDKYTPGTKNILDLGSGTELHAIHLAKQGYNIHGVDQSQDMVSIANERLNSGSDLKELLKFTVGDIRNIQIDQIFDTVVSLFHVMNYQTTNEDLQNSIKTAYNHLDSNGFFIFDCWYGPAVIADKPYKRTKTYENKNLVINRTAIPTMYPSKNMVDVNFDITITKKSTGKSERISELHKIRCDIYLSWK